eukprot:Gb_29881 [translate_table: standard]
MPCLQLHSSFHCHYLSSYLNIIRINIEFISVLHIIRQSPTLQLHGQLLQCTKNIHTDSDANAYASLLQACSNTRALEQVHALMLVDGLNQNVFLGTKLVNMYAKCGNLENARLVFDKVEDRDGFLWNVMIRGYARNGLCEETLALYYQMQRVGIQPDNFTFPFVLKACADMSSLSEGKRIHHHIIKTGFESHIFVETALIDMYAKCKSMENAHQVFDRMSTRDAFSWSAMIAGYAQNGHPFEALKLFHQMQLTDISPDSVTMVSALQACANLGALQQGKWIHDYILRSGFESDVSVGNTLVAMYAKCGSIQIARQLFEHMSERNVISWSAMIAGYAQNGYAPDAFTLFSQMMRTHVKPNSVTMVSVLSACAQLGALQHGKCIHAYIIRHRLESNSFVGNSLIDMYTKCGMMEYARQVFYLMCQKNVVTWNAMIAGYSQNGHFNEALATFHEMQMSRITPDAFTIVSVLSACAHLGALQQGKWIHDYVTRSGLDSNVFVGNSLIDMYAKCGSIGIARQLFNRMSRRDVVSWNAMIAGYSHNGDGHEFLTLFYQMLLVGETPESGTIVSVLLACANLGALQQGKWIHNYIIRSGFESDAFVQTALIDMYAKCGNVEIARNLFDTMPERNVVAYSAMIAGYGMHGYGEDALVLFSQMQQTGMKPNRITFICVLSACSHAGLVDEGWQYFDSMSRDYCITPSVEHYACMVDLLGRAGHLEQAQNFIENMPVDPNAGVWGALLGACRIHCNIELGERVARILFDLEPGNAGYYVLLSNIYAAAGRWDEVAMVRIMMKDRGLRKPPGYSLIEINNRVHAFVVGDRSHPQSEKIYAMLETLVRQIKETGYVSKTNFVLHDVKK